MSDEKQQSTESNMRACKICKQLKIRTLVGRYNHKDKKFVDETGAAWMGNTCPPCNRERVKNKMKEKRSLSKNA